MSPDEAAALARARLPGATVTGVGFPARPRGAYRIALRELGDDAVRGYNHALVWQAAPIRLGLSGGRRSFILSNTPRSREEVWLNAVRGWHTAHCVSPSPATGGFAD